MKTWAELTHYAGLDWAQDHHTVVIVDRQGQIAADFQFAHSAEGWKSFQDKIAPWPHLAVAIETSQGAVVDQLMQRGYTVFPVHPVAACHYRKRKAPTGTKTDHVDAWSLADALRVDGQHWKVLAPMDPLTQQLRLLCRDEVALIQQRTALVNQLKQALLEYYPAALEAFEDWTTPNAWGLVLSFPTARDLAMAGRSKWEKFLHERKLWRPETLQKRLELFARADEFKISPAIVLAKSRLAVSLCKVLVALEEQLQLYRRQIDELFGKHPDHHLFGSLPGAKTILSPRLLAAFGSDPDRYGCAEVLQSMAGTAPVMFESGKARQVRIRWACDKFMRHTMHLWANSFRHASAWGQAYYLKKKQEGKSHSCALRCLGQRLLKIVFRMMSDKTPYDAELHARNQLKHGSWILRLGDGQSTKSA